MRVGRPSGRHPADQELLLRVYELVRDDVGLADGVRVLRTWPEDDRRRALLARESRPRALIDLTPRRHGVPDGPPTGWPHDRARELLLASLAPGDPPGERRGPEQRAQDGELARLVRLPVAEAFEELCRRSPELAKLADALGPPLPRGAPPEGTTLRTGFSALRAGLDDARHRTVLVRDVVGPESSAQDPVLRSGAALRIATVHLLGGIDGLGTIDPRRP